MALKRIKKELEEIKRSPPIELMVGLRDDNNYFLWEGLLSGPEDSPYSGGIFKFVINFPHDYPMRAPKVKFTTKIFHPNISVDGDICVDILKDKWSSVFTVSKIMLSISSLLTDPNPESALNGESARLYLNDRNSYNKMVKEWVKKYGSPENL